MRPHFSRLLSLGLLAATAATSAAQEREGKAWEDPYTQGDAKLVAQAGYERVGSVQLGPGQSSDEVEHALALENRIAWIETAHFKIGAELPLYKPDREERKELNEELERLRKRLPKVKAGAGMLDPWLRAHLVAQRSEEHYATFLKDFGLEDSEFKADAKYLGMKSKFGILLFTKESTLGTYAQTFLKREAKAALQHYLANDCLLYLDALEVHKADHRRDIGLRSRLAYNVGVNVIDGYRGFLTMSPPWWREGYGQVLAREVHPKYAPIFDPRIYENDQEQAWVWEPRVYGRARHNIAATAEKLFGLEKAEQLDFLTTMIAWSRVEFLLTLEIAARKKFLDALQTIDAPRLPEPERVAKQNEALTAAFGFDMATFDQRWREYVLKNYERR